MMNNVRELKDSTTKPTRNSGSKAFFIKIGSESAVFTYQNQKLHKTIPQNDRPSLLPAKKNSNPNIHNKMQTQKN